MKLSLSGIQIRKSTLAVLFLFQFIILISMYFNAGTLFMWLWSILSFFPALIICFFVREKKYVLSSLALLFVSQQAVFIFANAPWGFTYGSDPINDFHTASVLSERAHFQLGQLSYASRLAYGYYPMLHLFSVILGDISNVPLIQVAMYAIPILNAVLTAFFLYYLNNDLFGLEGIQRNIATLFFGMSFYYTAFDSQFVRETFAFPLVLLSLLVFIRIAKSQNRAYVPIALILIFAVVLSHQISSYILLIIFAIIAMGFGLFQKNNRLYRLLFLVIIALGFYTSFVVLSFSATEWQYAIEGIQAIFNREGSYAILRSASTWRIFLSYAYYAILGIFIIVGGVQLLRNKKKDRLVISTLALFAIAFVLSVLLRFSTSADPWSWTYYMALRGTIWAFLGISVIAAIGVAYILRLNSNVSLKGFLVLLLIVCVLATGKFAQYPTLVTDSSSNLVTYQRYTATLWLKAEATHGSNILVAPYTVDMDAFDASRCMAPYAYLKEYFLDETNGHSYDKFSGYIPFVGRFFDQYKDLPNVQIIYDNGDTQVGYKGK